MQADTQVLYVTRFVPGYRKPILELLNEALSGTLIVAAGAPEEGSSFHHLHDDAPPSYQQRFVRNIWIGNDLLHWQSLSGIWKDLPERTIVLFEESPRTMSLPLSIRQCRRRGWPVILWGHFVSRFRSREQASMRDRYRMWMASRSDALVTYTESLRAELLNQSGLPPVFAAPNTLNSKPLIACRKQLDTEGRDRLRSRLGLDLSKPCLVFIGRLIPEKGVHVFLDVVERYSDEQGAGVQAVVIGDGPERTALEKRVRAAQLDVRFTGALSDPLEAAPWIVASDVLLNPGYVGLSLNHAMLLGTPVVAPMPASGERLHSPEWDFLKDGINGIKSASSSVEDLFEAVNSALHDNNRLRAQTMAWADENLSSDRMIEGLLAAVNHVSAARQVE